MGQWPFESLFAGGCNFAAVFHFYAIPDSAPVSKMRSGGGWEGGGSGQRASSQPAGFASEGQTTLPNSAKKVLAATPKLELMFLQLRNEAVLEPGMLLEKVTDRKFTLRGFRRSLVGITNTIFCWLRMPVYQYNMILHTTFPLFLSYCMPWLPPHPSPTKPNSLKMCTVITSHYFTGFLKYKNKTQ